MQGRQSMTNAGGEGGGEGNTQGRPLGLVQLSRGRAAEEECNTCGNTDGHACTSDADGKGKGEEERGGGGGTAQGQVSRMGGKARHQQGGGGISSRAATASGRQ